MGLHIQTDLLGGGVVPDDGQREAAVLTDGEVAELRRLRVVPAEEQIDALPIASERGAVFAYEVELQIDRDRDVAPLQRERIKIPFRQAAQRFLRLGGQGEEDPLLRHLRREGGEHGLVFDNLPVAKPVLIVEPELGIIELDAAVLCRSAVPLHGEQPFAALLDGLAELGQQPVGRGRLDGDLGVGDRRLHVESDVRLFLLDGAVLTP